MKSRPNDFADLLVVVLLVIGSLWILETHQIKSDDAIATMIGALLGAAALFLGNWISRWNERRRESATLAERVKKIETLIVAELVNVAAGHIGALNYMQAAIRTVEAGGAVPAHENLTHQAPREMPFTVNLGAELLILRQRDLDVLMTLRSNLSLTRLAMDEVTAGTRQFGLLTAQRLAEGLQADMILLAEAFEELAPSRALTLPGAITESASTILRRMAAR